MLAILRARQLFGGAHAIPGLRQALGLAEDGTDERATVDQTEAKARELVAALQATGWDPSAADRLTGNADAAAVLRFAATEVIPRLAGTATEIEQVLRALDGRFIPAGPSGRRCAPGQRATHRAQLLLRGSQGGAVPAGVGSRCGTGRFAAGALPR